MDLLYRAYSSPMDLMYRYIQQGRFGTFVNGFLQAQYDRDKKEAERENEWMLWTAYIHSYSDKPYGEWKKDFIKPVKKTKDSDLTEDGIKSLVTRLFPS